MLVVFRSVTVALQNNTNELLTIESFEAMRGEWGPPGPPRRGDVVEKQSSAKWVNQSLEDGFGVMGFVRLGSTKGYIDISWNLPYLVDQRTQSVQVPPGLDYRIEINAANLDQVVMVVTLVRK